MANLLWILIFHVAISAYSLAFDPCQRQPFYSMCHTWPEGSGRPYRSQVVMRFYRLGDECISYPYGLCKSDVAAAKLFRYQYQCEKSCMHWGNGTVAESGPLPPPISFIAEVASIRVEPRDDLFSPNGSAGQSGSQNESLVKVGICPFPEVGEYAVCVRECHLDYECPRNLKCCYNGCGRLCLEPRAVNGDPCEHSKDHGGCYGYFRRWWYDVGINACKQFIYGGCGGTGNNFLTEAACMDTCWKPGKSGSTLSPAPTVPIDDTVTIASSTVLTSTPYGNASNETHAGNDTVPIFIHIPWGNGSFVNITITERTRRPLTTTTPSAWSTAVPTETAIEQQSTTSTDVSETSTTAMHEPTSSEGTLRVDTSTTTTSTSTPPSTSQPLSTLESTPSPDNETQSTNNGTGSEIIEWLYRGNESVWNPKPFPVYGGGPGYSPVLGNFIPSSVFISQSSLTDPKPLPPTFVAISNATSPNVTEVGPGSNGTETNTTTIPEGSPTPTPKLPERQGAGSVVNEIHYIVEPHTSPYLPSSSPPEEITTESFQTHPPPSTPAPSLPPDNSIIYCPHNVPPLKNENGSFMTCLPAPFDKGLSCPRNGTCFFNGLNFYCCPDLEAVFSQGNKAGHGKYDEKKVDERGDRSEEVSFLQNISQLKDRKPETKQVEERAQGERKDNKVGRKRHV